MLYRVIGRRIWETYEFTDERWGMNSAPTPKSPVSLDTTYRLADWLRHSIKLVDATAAKRNFGLTSPSRHRDSWRVDDL